MSIIETLSQPWHWAVSGAAIAGTMLLLTWMGRSFGVSATFRDMCTIAGAGKKHEFFRINIKDEYWRLAFVLGAVVGGFIASRFLASADPVAISQSTIDNLRTWGINYFQSVEEGTGMVATSVFNFTNIKGILLAIIGGFFVGFGARYADGCTSGHAISGLSHLKPQSLLTVTGFFIGGLLMTHLILPLLF